jgi:hypothetical protein
MVASVTLYGPWHVQVTSLDTDFDQQVVLAGSDQDGIYPGSEGTEIHATGDEWTVSCEWQNPNAPGWFPSDIRVAKSHTATAGLVYVLWVDDNTTDPNRDLDYNDIVVTCTCEDPEIVIPVTHSPVEFVLSEDQIIREAGGPD